MNHIVTLILTSYTSPPLAEIKRNNEGGWRPRTSASTSLRYISGWLKRQSWNNYSDRTEMSRFCQLIKY